MTGLFSCQRLSEGLVEHDTCSFPMVARFPRECPLVMNTLPKWMEVLFPDGAYFVSLQQEDISERES